MRTPFDALMSAAVTAPALFFVTRRTASSTSSGSDRVSDLVDVLDDAADGLVLVHDAVDAEAPHGGAAEGRQQHATHRVAEGVAEAALERLEPELGDVRVVFALGGFDELRADESAEIDRVWHDGFGLVLPETIRYRPTPPFTRGRLEWE
jgi:hypothetical protein